MKSKIYLLFLETWQAISIAATCNWSKNSIHHEVTHALGRTHEFQRPDRDNHIKMITNAASGATYKMSHIKASVDIFAQIIPFFKVYLQIIIISMINPKSK
jgi:hypothetical protein